jgi:hypothetical protein
MLERLGGALRLLALDGEARAAPRDGDVERGLDLAQVLVERAAQAGEALVVDGIEADFDRSRPRAAQDPSLRAASCGVRIQTRCTWPAWSTWNLTSDLGGSAVGSTMLFI